MDSLLLSKYSKFTSQKTKISVYFYYTIWFKYLFGTYKCQINIHQYFFFTILETSNAREKNGLSFAKNAGYWLKR